LTQLANEPAETEKEAPVSETMEAEAEIDALDMDELNRDDHPGTLSALVCPDCGGALWEIEDGDALRYRCRVGHSFSMQTMLAEHAEMLEDAFWVALRTLEESASLSKRLAERARSRGQQRSAEHFEDQVAAAQERARLLRDVILAGILNVRSEDGIENSQLKNG
jgi:two-component system, chemotaxis family, protein-glutamate methylesterase/glutaminase